MEIEPEHLCSAEEPVIEAFADGASSVAEPTKTNDAVTSEPVAGNRSEKEFTSSENDSKLPVLAEEAIAFEKTKRESTDQVAGEIQASLPDPGFKKQVSTEFAEGKPEPMTKVSIEDDDEKEEGEEDGEEGMIADEGVAASANSDAPKQDPGVDAKVEKKNGDGDGEDKPAADSVDLMSFVILKKKIQRTADPSSTHAPASS